jgi:hypothetical protein
MITSFEVGSVFKIKDQASPALRAILKQVRELNVALDQARENLATLGKSVMPIGLTRAVGETEGLATAWGDVAKNAAIAQRAIGAASTTASRTALPAAAAAATGGGGAGRATGGGGGRHRPGWLGGGAHVYGPGVSMPGGTHCSLRQRRRRRDIRVDPSRQTRRLQGEGTFGGITVVREGLRYPVQAKLN